MAAHAFGSQNIRHSEVKKNIQRVLELVRREFPKDLSVLALQELTGAKKGWITSAMPGWDLWWKQVPTNGTGLIWDNSRWDKVRQGLRVIYKPGRDGPVERYNGKDMWQWRRFASWVTLRDRATNKISSFISVHGKLGGEGKGNQWKRLRALVHHLQKVGAVHIAGDFNTWLKDMPGWLQDMVSFSHRIDHLLATGPIKRHGSVSISEARLGHLVDHPGVAVRWSFA